MESIKEKARFYDLIIGRAKKELDGCSSLTCDTASLIFKLIPELNIDENERIADEIIQFLLLPHPQFVGKRNYEEWIAWIKKQCKQSSTKKSELVDYKEFNNFEKTLANICIDWKGKKGNWAHYIKDNADILLRIAKNAFDSIQDAPFEEKPNQFDEGFKAGFTAAKFNQWKPTDTQMLVLNDLILSGCLPNGKEKILRDLQQQLTKLREEQATVNEVKPMYHIGDFIIPLNDTICEVVDICVSVTNGTTYTLKRRHSDIISNDIFQADAHTIDDTATLVRKL